MRLRLPYYFHYKAWLMKGDRLRGGVWAFIRKHEGRLP